MKMLTALLSHLLLPGALLGLALVSFSKTGAAETTPLVFFTFFVLYCTLLLVWQHYRLPSYAPRRLPALTPATRARLSDPATRTRPAALAAEPISVEGGWNPLGFLLGMSTGAALAVTLMILGIFRELQRAPLVDSVISLVRDLQ